MPSRLVLVTFLLAAVACEGPAGPPGANGAQGPQGDQGLPGVEGDDGSDGAQGGQGSKGDAGSEGPQGPKGDQGDEGSEGPQGPKGDEGEAGSDGPQGPPGPLSIPPSVLGLSSTWGSVNTQLVIRGSGFSATPGDNRVTFDGSAATVLSATTTRLAVQIPSSLTPWSPRWVAVAVEVARQVSAPVGFELVPSGTARMQPIALPISPFAAAKVGDDLYVASTQFINEGGGIYRVEKNSGRTTRVLGVPSTNVPTPGGVFTIYDAPVAMIAEGSDLYYTTVMGSVRRYNVKSRRLYEVAPPNQGPGGGGDDFPALTGIARDAAGTLYVVNRNLPPRIDGRPMGGVIRISPNGMVDAITEEELFAHAWGVAVNGADVFVTNETAEFVTWIKGAGGYEAIRGLTGTIQGDNGPEPWFGARGIAVLGDNLVVSTVAGLYSVPLADADGGTFAPYNASPVKRAESLSASAEGDLYLAQGEAQAVRRLPDGASDSTMEASGLGLMLGAAMVEGRLYLAGTGALGPGGLPTGASALVEIDLDDHWSRIIARGDFFTGLTDLTPFLAQPSPPALAVSDCAIGEGYNRSRILGVEIDSGATTDLVRAAASLTDANSDGLPDGLLCPAGLAMSSSGELLFLHGIPFGGGAFMSVGKFDGSNADLGYVTGIDGPGFSLTVNGDLLIVGGLGLGPGGFPPVPVWTADADGGSAERLLEVPVSTVATSPAGVTYLARAGGQIQFLDPYTGDLALFTSAMTRAPMGGGGGGGPGSFSMAPSMAFREDGTLLLPDWGQQGVVAIAP